MTGFGLIELLAAAGVVFWVGYSCRTKADGPIARLMRHRDRHWFALLLLFVPAIALHFLLFHLFLRQATYESFIAARTVIGIFNVFDGAIYGMAGCCIASPARREERFSYWTALTVAVVVIILTSGLSMLIRTFRIVPAESVQIIPAAVVVLAFLISRAFVGKRPEPPQAGLANSAPNKKIYNPAPAFLWLLVGLAPIPILLAVISSRRPNPTWGVTMLIVCALCNLLGGLGCLGGIKNIGVQIILGIFLAIVFFLLSWIIAVFQACSHSGGL